MTVHGHATGKVSRPLPGRVEAPSGSSSELPAPIRSEPEPTADTQGASKDSATAQTLRRFDGSAEPILVTDRNGVIIDCNSAAAVSFGDVVEGVHISSLFAPAYAGLCDFVLRRALEGTPTRPVRMNTLNRQRWNARGAVEVSATESQRGGSGNDSATRIAWTVRDIQSLVDSMVKSFVQQRFHSELGRLSELAVRSLDPDLVSQRACSSILEALKCKSVIAASGAPEFIAETLQELARGTEFEGSRIADPRFILAEALAATRRVGVETISGRIELMTSLEPFAPVVGRRAIVLIGDLSAPRGAFLISMGGVSGKFSQPVIEFLKTHAAIIEATHAAVESRERVRTMAILEERNRLAMDIHDSLAQDFSSLVWQLSALQVKLKAKGGDPETIGDVGEIADRARALLDQTRTTVWDLKSNPLNDRPLAKMVEQALLKSTEGREIEINCVVTGEARRLRKFQGIHLLRIAEQAIGNAVAHSRCSSICVRLHYGDSEITLSVEDNGRGFDRRTARHTVTPGRGMGLHNMEERARAIGGTLEIKSAPGQGTIICVAAPVKPVIDASFE